MLAGVLLMLFLAWNGSQTFRELQAKQRVLIHCVKETYPLFISITRAHTSTIVHSIFSVMAGLIVEMLFMLFSVYNTSAVMG